MKKVKHLKKDIKNNNKYCDICKQKDITGCIEYNNFTCAKPECVKTGNHYHDVCIRCCDKIIFSKLEAFKNNFKF